MKSVLRFYDEFEVWSENEWRVVKKCSRWDNMIRFV
jgi:hypothetical protein